MLQRVAALGGALLALAGSCIAAPIAIRAKHALDVRSGTLIENAVVLIDGERITAFGAGLTIPDGATVIDLKDRTILPGLIDCHTHIMASSADEYATMLLTKSQAYRALEGAANARATLLAGFTAVRDVENEGSGYADVALRDAIDRGLVQGPRMRVATRGIAVIGQYVPFGISPDLPDFPHGAQMISGVEEARRAARERSATARITSRSTRTGSIRRSRPTSCAPSSRRRTRRDFASRRTRRRSKASGTRSTRVSTRSSTATSRTAGRWS